MNVGVGSFPRRRAQVRPDSIAWEFEGAGTSYGEVAHRVDALASALQAQGVRGGDRVAYVGFNHPALLEVFFAANLAGATCVLVNPRLAEEEVRFILQDCGARVSVFGSEQVALANALPEVTRWVGVERVASDTVAGDLESLIAAHRTSPPLVPAAADDDVALIMYTSGTTGRPKGAMLTHRNLTYQYLNALLSTDVRQDEVHLAVAPLFHIAGLNMMTLPSFMLGGRLIIHRAFRPDAVLSTIGREGVTSSFMVPAMIDALAQHPDFGAARLGSLRSIMVGGSPLPERSIRVWSERGVRIMQGFGMTETAPGVCLLDARDAEAKAGSAGRPHFFSEVRLVDPVSGRDVGVGQAGEVWVRGPQVMSGYWNRPEASAEALAGGWYHSGDVAVRDIEGYFTIKDRLKDMYISGGENVYPAEVENALLNVPGVLEAAVVGVPDERWGESGCAFVVVAPGMGDVERVRIGLAQRLARYKLPRDIVVVAELPRTTTGKLRKSELRGAHSSG